MPNYFYTDTSGNRRGPVTPEALKALASQRIIKPNTPLETDSGKKTLAGQLSGLFNAPPQPAAPKPAAVNPFTTPLPKNDAAKPQGFQVPNITGFIGSFFSMVASAMRAMMSFAASMTAFVLVLLLCGIVAYVVLWVFYMTNPNIPMPGWLRPIFPQIVSEANVPKDEQPPKPVESVNPPAPPIVPEDNIVKALPFEPEPTASEPPPPSEPPVVVPLPPSPPDLSQAVHLAVTIRESGFGNQQRGILSGWTPLKAFVKFGNTRLESRLEAANALRPDPLDDVAIGQKRVAVNTAETAIKNAQREIAETIYREQYTISISNVQNLGGGISTLDMSIPTEIRHTKVGDVSFPVPDVEKVSESGMSYSIRFSVSGDTTHIAELRDSRDLRARVWFTNLRYGGSISSTPTADILKVEIVRLGAPSVQRPQQTSQSGQQGQGTAQQTPSGQRQQGGGFTPGTGTGGNFQPGAAPTGRGNRGAGTRGGQ